MSISHIGSKLRLNGKVQVLPEGMYLFPLDARVNDTTVLMNPILNTSTPKLDEYKFRGSVAVEDATVNLIPDGDFSTRVKQGSYSNVTRGITSFETMNDAPMSSIVLRHEATDVDSHTGPYQGTSGNLGAATQGETWTTSVYVKAEKETTVSLYIFPLDTNLALLSAPYKAFTVGTEWARIEFKTTMPTGTTNISARLDNDGGAGSIVYWNGWQLEKKDHSTSFTEGTRATGNLKYDISTLGIRDAACISCWIYNSDTMVNNLASGGTVNNQYMIKLGSFKLKDWYDDAMTLWIQNASPRHYRFWSSVTDSSGTNTDDHIISQNTIDMYGGVGSWNHFVIQWDKSGLPSGNTKEFYINGVLQSGNKTASLPANILTYLHLGQWSDNGSLMPSTLFEQLAIHPSKGFSAETIKNWYESRTLFLDPRDKTTNAR